MNLNDDVIYRGRRFGPFGEFHSGQSRCPVCYDYRFHLRPAWVVKFHLSVRLF
jgi:hypothetical protein